MTTRCSRARMRLLANGCVSRPRRLTVVVPPSVPRSPLPTRRKCCGQAASLTSAGASLRRTCGRGDAIPRTLHCPRSRLTADARRRGWNSPPHPAHATQHCRTRPGRDPALAVLISRRNPAVFDKNRGRLPCLCSIAAQPLGISCACWGRLQKLRHHLTYCNTTA